MAGLHKEALIRDGHRAQRTLDDPIVVAAFATIEQDTFDQIRTASVDGLVQAQAKLQLLDSFRKELEVQMSRAEGLEAELARERRVPPGS